ncbi:MAG: TonB-dependent receptor [Bacteroidales bacterium]|nr:TonB-dependent receptor [Bacteroidales bacterium]
MKSKANVFLRSFCMFFILGWTGSILAQPVTVTGIVTDAASGMPVPGVNIIIQGSTTGTMTNEEGVYTLEVNNPDVILVFSSIGYTTRSIALEGRQTLNVELEEEITTLDELVVIGYGTQRKSDLTGAVSVVNTDDIEKVVSNNISRVLQGQAAGVQVHGSGEPGANPVIKIRGIGSFRNNAPLYVIDGVPVDGLADFNPGDIESIQVLKDASSCAIYGARGANGVIIITTKKGRPGDLTVNYEGSYGVQNIAKRMELTNREQFQEMNNLARFNDLGFWAPARANDSTSAYYVDSIDTDWQEEALKTGHITEHTLSMSGGTETGSYHFSANYFDQTGTIVGPGPRYTRYSFRMNSDFKKGRFKFGESVYYSYSDKVNLTTSQWGNTMVDLVLAAPTIPVYDENNLGGYGGALDYVHDQIIPNIIAFNNLFESIGLRNRILGAAYAELEIFKGLAYKLNLSFDRTDWHDTYFLPKYFVGDRYRNDIAYLDDTRGDHVIMLMENTLNFDRQFGKHSINLLAGYTSQYGKWQQISGHAEGYEEPYFKVIDAGPNLPKSVSGRQTEHAILSYLGRVNYSYDDRYLLTANFRRDGSSRFGPEYRWGNFPSLAVGWKINNESFFQVDFISALKLRAGYGVIGNEASIPDYQYAAYLNQYSTYVIGGQLPPASIQTQLATRDIHWEEKMTMSVGLDAAFMANRLEINMDYFYNEATDLLLQLPLPISNGSNANPYQNAASMSNRGFECFISYRKRSGDLFYQVSANFTTLKNKVLKLGKLDVPINTWMSNTEVGQPVGQIYGWDMIGIFQTRAEIDSSAYQTARPGDVKFRDVDGRDAEGNLTGEPDGIINDDDRVYLGSALPKLTGGINFSLSWRGIDFSLFAQGSYGNKIVNGLKQVMDGMKYGNYSLETYENYWRLIDTDQPELGGTTNEYPRPTVNNPNDNTRMSQRWLQDGSYLKIQNVQLGYTFDSKILSKIPGITSLRIYLSAQNLFTFTKYTGYDPDIGNDGLFYRGLDYGSYPSPRTILFGVKLAL